uniref:small monomeric GTPase n=1 Tax=Vombatus ursinus TaxID=29139 RepID=A0A4X2LTR0_VOMUR
MRHKDPSWMASAQDSRYGQKDTSDQNFDYMFKLLIIGNSSVGKTSFLFRYADDSFTSAFVSTVGIDFKVKTVFKNEKRIKLQIWDTAGQERYRTITTAYYRGAMGFILMYDITNEESFNAVQDWSTQIKTYSWDNAQVILVGNKCDMEDERSCLTLCDPNWDFLGKDSGMVCYFLLRFILLRKLSQTELSDLARVT